MDPATPQIRELVASIDPSRNASANPLKGSARTCSSSARPAAGTWFALRATP